MRIVKDHLRGFSGRACLVAGEAGYFVVSTTDIPKLGNYEGLQLGGCRETMAFPADADGRVTDWLEVAGGRGYTRADVIAAPEEMEFNRQATQ